MVWSSRPPQSGPQTGAPDPPRIPPECVGSPKRALPEFAVLAHRRSVHAPRCALGACCLPRQAALAHLHDHRRLHNCPDELRRRDFHSLPRSLKSRGLSLQDHRHIHNCPDELRRRNFHSLPQSLNTRDLSLQHHWRDPGKLRHLVDLRDHRHVHNFVGERHERGFHRLCHCLNIRDLSLQHHRHIDNNRVDVLNLRNIGVLGHLVERPSEALAYRRSAKMRSWSSSNRNVNDLFTDLSRNTF